MFRILIFVLVWAGYVTAYADEPMQFTIEPNTPKNAFLRAAIGRQHEIFAFGEIDTGTTERFQKFVTVNSINDAIVLLDSHGGSLIEGVRLGKAIRTMRFNTGIGTYVDREERKQRLYQGICASACAYAFAGGEYRFYEGGKEKLGIHQFYAAGDNQADIGSTQIVSSILVDYLQQMGVDPQTFVAASKTRGDSMLWLTSDQASSLGLSNNGSKQTVAEVKLYGKNPYLKVEQVHSNVTTRVLWNCKDNRPTLLAGIVTSPELSKEKQSSLVKSYLETDGGEILILQGRVGTSAVNSVLWLDRDPTNNDLQKILQTTQLGIWTENGGPMKWGATIDLSPAKGKIIDFINNCKQGH